MFAALRQLLPSTAALSQSAMPFSSSASTMLMSALGKSQRCTDSGADLSTLRTMFWYISSLMKGMKGAHRRLSVSSTV